MVHRNEVDDGEIKPKPRDKSDGFTGTHAAALASETLLDFWRWAYSDIVVNTNRGCLAEFIVSKALAATELVRIEWAPWDLTIREPTTREKLRVEVKSSAYLQSWKQRRIAVPKFNIGKKKDERLRPSDVYVFCLLAYKDDKELLNPLDLGQWKFYVVATSRIDDAFGDRKSVSLPQLQRELKCTEYAVDELAEAVQAEGKKNR